MKSAGTTCAGLHGLMIGMAARLLSALAVAAPAARESLLAELPAPSADAAQIVFPKPSGGVLGVE